MCVCVCVCVWSKFSLVLKSIKEKEGCIAPIFQWKWSPCLENLLSKCWLLPGLEDRPLFLYKLFKGLTIGLWEICLLIIPVIQHQKFSRDKENTIKWFCISSNYMWLYFVDYEDQRLQFSIRYEGHTVSFQTFFVWALLMIVHRLNSSPLRSNLLRLQCTYCIVQTTSGRPHRSTLVWACQWPSSQPLSSPQLSHKELRE